MGQFALDSDGDTAWVEPVSVLAGLADEPYTLLMQVMHLLSKQGKSKMQRRLHKVRLQRQKMSKMSLRMQRASLQSMHS